MCDSINIFSTTNSRPLDHRTNASGVSIRCFFGSVRSTRSFPLASWVNHQRVASQYTRDSHPAVALNRTRFVHDEAMHRKSTGELEHKGHGDLAGWRIIERLRTSAQGSLRACPSGSGQRFFGPVRSVWH